MPAPDASDDTALLREAVEDAGQLARELGAEGSEHWCKQDGTPISHADLRVNELLKDRLTGARPDYGWLSEETQDDRRRLDKRRVWVIDPIDGTSAFLKGDPHWTVSAALVEDGRPVVGMVYNPMTAEFFEAASGKGARLNGDVIQVSERSDLKGARMIMHRSLLRSDRWAEPWPDLTAEMRNSMAYRLCLVASGAFDATVVVSAKSEWDLAAADLVVHEAGGTVSAHDGARFTYNQAAIGLPNVLAAGPGLYDTLLTRTRARRNT